MEMSRRGKDFIGIAEKAEANLSELLAVPNDYKVLFLPASLARVAVECRSRRGLPALHRQRDRRRGRVPCRA